MNSWSCHTKGIQFFSLMGSRLFLQTHRQKQQRTGVHRCNALSRRVYLEAGFVAATLACVPMTAYCKARVPPEGWLCGQLKQPGRWRRNRSLYRRDSTRCVMEARRQSARVVDGQAPLAVSNCQPSAASRAHLLVYSCGANMPGFSSVGRCIDHESPAFSATTWVSARRDRVKTG
jgi:hypothetical protein